MSETEQEIKVTTYIVYKEDAKSGNLLKQGTIETERYSPGADDVGEKFGAGTFVVFQDNSKAEESYQRKYLNGTKMVVKATTYFSEDYE